MSAQKEKTLDKPFGERFRQFMQHFNQNDKMLSEAFGVHRNLIGRYKNGERPSFETLVKLSETYPVNLHWLLTGVGSVEVNTNETGNGSAEAAFQSAEIKRLTEMVNVQSQMIDQSKMFIEYLTGKTEGAGKKWSVSRNATGRVPFRRVDTVHTIFQRFNERHEEREVKVNHFGQEGWA